LRQSRFCRGLVKKDASLFRRHIVCVSLIDELHDFIIGSCQRLDIRLHGIHILREADLDRPCARGLRQRQGHTGNRIRHGVGTPFNRQRIQCLITDLNLSILGRRKSIDTAGPTAVQKIQIRLIRHDGDRIRTAGIGRGQCQSIGRCHLCTRIDHRGIDTSSQVVDLLTQIAQGPRRPECHCLIRTGPHLEGEGRRPTTHDVRSF